MVACQLVHPWQIRAGRGNAPASHTVSHTRTYAPHPMQTNTKIAAAVIVVVVVVVVVGIVVVVVVDVVAPASHIISPTRTYASDPIQAKIKIGRHRRYTQ